MAKPAKKAEAHETPKLKTVKLQIPPDILKAMRTECLGHDCSLSTLLIEAFKTSGRRFVLVDRPRAAPAPRLHQAEESPAALDQAG